MFSLNPKDVFFVFTCQYTVMFLFNGARCSFLFDVAVDNFTGPRSLSRYFFDPTVIFDSFQDSPPNQFDVNPGNIVNKSCYFYTSKYTTSLLNLSKRCFLLAIQNLAVDSKELPIETLTYLAMTKQSSLDTAKEKMLNRIMIRAKTIFRPSKVSFHQVVFWGT